MLAVILSAAMSSTASELNALGTTTSIDLYKRNLKHEKDEAHYVRASKWFTLLWGVIAILFANFGTLVENLIQLVNIVGSIFYGTVLGIFLLAFFVKYVRGHAAFWGGLFSQSIIFGIYYLFIYSQPEEKQLGYLSLNFIGCVLVMGIAIVIQAIENNTSNIRENSIDS